jgi:hypothetical protein
MQYRDDDDEEDDAVVLELRQLKAREQDREARERARLAKMVGALNGEFAPPLPINLSHKPAAGFSVRPDRWVGVGVGGWVGEGVGGWVGGWLGGCGCVCGWVGGWVGVGVCACVGTCRRQRQLYRNSAGLTTNMCVCVCV